MTAVIGYVRVSTAEQTDGAGLAAQRSAIEAEVARRGWTLVGIEEDAGVSGKSLAGRSGLAAALDAIESGKADGLIVSKLDRLSRSLVDFASLMARSQRKGWSLIALDLGVDTSTPAGEFLASVLASAAQWERRIIGQRTKDALTIKRAQGIRLGRPPMVDESTVNRLTELRSSGLSLRQVAHLASVEGLPTGHGAKSWSAETVRGVLKRTQVA